MTWVDGVILGILAISGLLAFSRGLVREVLSIGAWIGALAIAAKMQPVGKEVAAQWVKEPQIASAASFVVLLLVSLILLKLVARAISNMIRSTGLGGIDRTFGLLFGLARGAFVVITAYILAGTTMSIDRWPAAAREARSLPWVYEGAVWVRANLLPDDYRPKLYAPPSALNPTSDSLLRAAPLGRAVLGK